MKLTLQIEFEIPKDLRGYLQDQYITEFWLALLKSDEKHLSDALEGHFARFKIGDFPTMVGTVTKARVKK